MNLSKLSYWLTAKLFPLNTVYMYFLNRPFHIFFTRISARHPHARGPRRRPCSAGILRGAERSVGRIAIGQYYSRDISAFCHFLQLFVYILCSTVPNPNTNSTSITDLQIAQRDCHKLSPFRSAPQIRPTPHFVACHMHSHILRLSDNNYFHAGFN